MLEILFSAEPKKPDMKGKFCSGNIVRISPDIFSFPSFTRIAGESCQHQIPMILFRGIALHIDKRFI